MDKIKKEISYKAKKKVSNRAQNLVDFTKEKAIEDFEELKQIALNCFDKNGNPNVSAAIKALENKAKIANLYSEGNIEIGTIVKMSEITIDGEQLKLNIGEDFKMEK